MDSLIEVSLLICQFILLLFVFGAVLLIYMAVEARLFKINRHFITIRKSLTRPIKILHLSDTHFSGNNRPVARFFDRLAQEQFDLIVITGDIFDCVSGVPACIANLLKLKSRHGVFAVFGNHDYFDYRFSDMAIHNFPGQSQPKNLHPVDLFGKALAEAGVRLMRNETDEIKIEGVSVLIHGLDDPTTGHANVRVALANYDSEKPNLLLTHTVDAFLDIGENEIDLAFSGHSHGGQICVPVIGPLITHTMLGRAYAAGIKRIKGAVCSISKGVGTSRFIPFRLMCPPEAVVLTVAGSGI